MGDTGRAQAKQENDKEVEPQPQPELEKQGTEQPKPKFRFQVLADREAKWTESRYWKDFSIGHAWIRMITPTGEVDSWGYWPDLWNGHGVDTSAPWKSVPGKVLHPDEQHVANATSTHEIEEETAKKVAQAANAKEASPGMYNLFTYNCTTFALEMAKLAGVPTPSGTLVGIANPNSLYAGIAEMNKQRGQDPMERSLDNGGGSGGGSGSSTKKTQ